jgi:hypothetical protein
MRTAFCNPFETGFGVQASVCSHDVGFGMQEPGKQVVRVTCPGMQERGR